MKFFRNLFFVCIVISSFNEFCGEKFYKFTLNAERLSDNCDAIPVTISERLLILGNLNVDNYVKLDNSLWRIVKITANDEVVLISQDGAGYATAWDDRYNEAKEYDAGINQYGVSRMREFLNKLYTNPSHDAEDGEYLLSKKRSC